VFEKKAEITFKRDELYEQVWKIPISRLAKQHGISDVGLAKICRKLNVPTPPVGYWAKVEFGKKVSHQPLPALDRAEATEYVYTRFERVAQQSSLPEIKGTLSPEKVIIVPDRLTAPHHLIRETKAVLNQMKPDKYGMLSPLRKRCLALRIGPASIDRALIILDTLIKGFEASGFVVSTDAEPKTISWVDISGERIPFTLLEDTHRIEHVMTEEEIKQKQKYSWSRVQLWDYTPTGNLSLIIDVWGVPGAKRKWSDSPRKRLEQDLGGFIYGAVFIAHILKEDRAKRAEEERKRQEEQAIREEAERQRAAEDTRFRELERQAEMWAKSEQLRAFIRTVETLIAEGSSPDDDRERIEKWIAWAKGHADGLDPLRELKAKKGA
jgi:hypothetical protein